MTDPIKKMVWAKYPIGNVTQWLGENIKLYAGVVDKYGKSIGLTKGHNGIDIVDEWGTPMYAVEDGVIKTADTTNSTGFGNYVRMISKDGKREWTYGHCSAIGVKKDQVVKEGQVIATMGNSGFVVSGNTPYWNSNPSAGKAHPGTHLHFGLRLLSKGKVLNYDNGRLGAVDPLPYFVNQSLISSKLLNSASVSSDKVLYSFAQLLQKIGL